MALQPRVWLLALCIGASGCNEAADRLPSPPGVALVEVPADPIELGQAFVRDARVRRALLLSSVVNPDNSYSSLRLNNYAVADSSGAPTRWDTRTVWNPPVRPWTRNGDPATDAPQPVFADMAWTHEGLMALGQRAFEEYPLSLEEAAEAVADDPSAAIAAGLWVDDRDRLGGLVEVVTDQGTRVGTTCATCHATPDETGALQYGLANADYDLGYLLALRASSEARRNALLSWGPGRVDVTPSNDDPAAIQDLRPIRHQPHLHWAATLDNSLGALAVRVDTLITTSLPGARPPREVSYALAYFLWNLEAPAPRPRGTLTDIERDEVARGEELFGQTCAPCHGDGQRPGPALPYELVDTDPLLAQSPDRGTGRWRVPSLWGVGGRRQLFHDASLDHVTNLFDPARGERGDGHTFGFDYEPSEQQALIAFLLTLGD